MSLQALSLINDNYQLAIAVHRELADLYWFIYLPGYAMLHEHYFIDESMTQRKIKRYITSTYHAFEPDKLPKSANIAEPFLTGKNRKTLTPDDTWKTVKESFRIYRDWEESALKEYQKTAQEILYAGDVAAFNFVSDEIIKDVKAELVYVTDKVIELSAMNWDMAQIVAEQPDYVERYEYLIRNMFGKSKKYHHHNSNLDAMSRMSLLDKHPD